MLVNESGSLRTTMTIINPNISSGRRRKHLTLILQIRIGLNHGDRIVTGSVLFQIRMPHQPITTTSSSARSPPKASLKRPVVRPQHHLLIVVVVAAPTAAAVEKFRVGKEEEKLRGKREMGRDRGKRLSQRCFITVNSTRFKDEIRFLFPFFSL